MLSSQDLNRIILDKTTDNRCTVFDRLLSYPVESCPFGNLKTR